MKEENMSLTAKRNETKTDTKETREEKKRNNLKVRKGKKIITANKISHRSDLNTCSVLSATRAEIKTLLQRPSSLFLEGLSNHIILELTVILCISQDCVMSSIKTPNKRNKTRSGSGLNLFLKLFAPDGLSVRVTL